MDQKIMKFCPGCGKMLRPGSFYCGNCGKKVITESDPAAGKTENKSASEKKRKRKPSRSFFGILLLMAVAASSYYLYTHYYEKPISRDSDSEILPEYSLKPVLSISVTTESSIAKSTGNGSTDIELTGGGKVSVSGLGINSEVKLERKTNSIDPGVEGIQATGAMLELTVNINGDPLNVKPVITFPAKEAGELDPSSLNILRESDIVLSDGTIARRQQEYLPVFVDKEKNLTVVDYHFPSSALRTGDVIQPVSLLDRIDGFFFASAYAQGKTYIGGIEYVASVKYTLITFQGNLNWSKNPRLVQMTPDNSSDSFRRTTSDKEKSERKKPVINVVILVHGHNEYEKGGNVANETEEPWGFTYKRDVWSTFYKTYLKASEEKNGRDSNGDLMDCTQFYEFIYPTYRPVFSPVPRNSVTRYKTLGEDFRDIVRTEFTKNNRIIASMIEQKIPFNLFIVSHSMGGLVARAGLKALDTDNAITSNFRNLVTWGTPHSGSALVTIRYMLAAGFTISVNGIPLPAGAFSSGAKAKKFADESQLDTPGSQDLRWTSGTRSTPEFFDFERLFIHTAGTINNDDMDLENGSLFFNHNLAAFNSQSAPYEKFTFLTGITSDIAELELSTGFLNYFSKAYSFKFGSTEIQQGAGLYDVFGTGDLTKKSDGAVPVFSQAGMSLPIPPAVVSMGDVTHEAFFNTGPEGTMTAKKTLEVIEKASKCDCPKIEVLRSDNNLTAGKVKLPLDINPGNRIRKMKIVVLNKDTKAKTEFDGSFTVKQDGSFEGNAPGSDSQTGNVEKTIVAEYRDGTEISSNLTTSNFSVSVGINGYKMEEINYDGSSEWRSRGSQWILSGIPNIPYSNTDGSEIKMTWNDRTEDNYSYYTGSASFVFNADKTVSCTINNTQRVVNPDGSTRYTTSFTASIEKLPFIKTEGDNVTETRYFEGDYKLYLKEYSSSSNNGEGTNSRSTSLDKSSGREALVRIVFFRDSRAK